MKQTKIPFSYQGSKLYELKVLSKFIKNGSKITEPFFGTGVVSAAFGKDNNCIANDYNVEIFNIWQYAKENNSVFLDECTRLMQEENRTEIFYYDNRSIYNETYWNTEINSPERSVLFYFLVNSCHAGMIRFGPNGFNTSIKLFLLNGRKYNVENRLELLTTFSKKINFIENKNAIDFLKDNEYIISQSDIIYCDPPYTNSVTPYINSWCNDDLIELDDYLSYMYKRYCTKSLMSNYYNSDIQYKGDIVHRFEKNRLASTKITMSDNILIGYGKFCEGIEKFYD